MNNGLKYLVVLRDPKGHFKLARVKAYNAKEATTFASEAWPNHFIYSIKPSISYVQESIEKATRPRSLIS